MEFSWSFWSCALHLTGIYHVLLRNQFWRSRKGEFWFMPPLILYLVNHCIRENLVANVRCFIEPLLDPDLYFDWQWWRNGGFSMHGRYDIVMSWAELRIGVFFRQELLYLPFNCDAYLVFNTDVLHYLPSCVQYPAYCEPVLYITYGNFFWRKL